MSVTLQLMTNEKDRKTINKTPTELGDPITCILKENTSIIKPTMLVSKDRLGEGWATANYGYVKEFGRYYFIDNATAETGGMIAFELTVDPLMTYSGGLMGTSFFIARSEKHGSHYFIDAEKALQSNKIVDYEIIGHIPQDTTGNKYVLTVSGGL